MLFDAVMSEGNDKLDPPYQVSKKSYEAYEQALILLAGLKGIGKCTFEYDSIFEPYDTHYVYVQWKTEKEFGIVLDKREIIDLVEKFDTLSLYEEEPNEWQLSTKIYYPKELNGNGDA